MRTRGANGLTFKKKKGPGKLAPKSPPLSTSNKRHQPLIVIMTEEII